MLVLSRKLSERVVVHFPEGVPPGGCVVVMTVTDLNNSKVRLGWEAPAYVKIDREDVYAEKTGNTIPKADGGNSPTRSHVDRAPRRY